MTDRKPLWYVATPYSKHKLGLYAAWQDACTVTARLIDAGVAAHSPIAHTHPIATLGGLDPLDHDIWIPVDMPIMHAADGLIVAMLDGWEDSNGVAVEIDTFKTAGKPIVYWHPSGDIPTKVKDHQHV